jgi:hypothetical protein
MRQKPAATPAFLLGCAHQQPPPSSRRTPGPIRRVAHENGSARGLALHAHSRTQTPGVMGPGVRRDDAARVCARHHLRHHGNAQTPPSSRRRPGPIRRVAHENGSAGGLALHAHSRTRTPGVMGPGVRRDDAGRVCARHHLRQHGMLILQLPDARTDAAVAFAAKFPRCSTSGDSGGACAAFLFGGSAPAARSAQRLLSSL